MEETANKCKSIYQIFKTMLTKEPRHKIVHIIWFHVYENLEIVLMLAWEEGWWKGTECKNAEGSI